MSEGWLTESTLLPSRPKSISGVNQKSLKPLQVLVAEKNRAETPLLITSPTHVEPIARDSQRSKKRSAKLDLLIKPGKSSRSEEHQNNLQKKVELYEALKTGRISEDEVLKSLRQGNSDNSETNKVRKEDLLVNFSASADNRSPSGNNLDPGEEKSPRQLSSRQIDRQYSMGAICGISKDSKSSVRQAHISPIASAGQVDYQYKSDTAKNAFDGEDYDGTDPQDKDFRKLIRSFTRRSMSTTARLPSMLSTGSSEFREGSRRPSILGVQQQIDDNDVIRLIAIKDNDKDSQTIKELCLDDDPLTAPAEKVPTEVLERARERRKTMEKLNVFSPDQIDDARLSDLYDASEHLYRQSMSSREPVESTA